MKTNTMGYIVMWKIESQRDTRYCFGRYFRPEEKNEAYKFKRELAAKGYKGETVISLSISEGRI
jgi:hypothetical protein